MIELNQEESSEKIKLSKVDTITEILRVFPNLIFYEKKAMEKESKNRTIEFKWNLFVQS